ncbi:MAG: hypothetical protein Ct9H90mP2_13020 [Dehalococcoidia bacterium]|nr:MAG: hypothetical protein Ct9H90mP2_13020 [Dehalococcoidia bacterium]
MQIGDLIYETLVSSDVNKSSIKEKVTHIMNKLPLP